MSSTSFDEYLRGTASDSNQAKCEHLLSQSETLLDHEAVAHTERLSNQDELIQALQAESAVESSANVESLAKRIESLVPHTGASSEEIQRVLSPPVDPNDLGSLGRYRVVEFIAGGGMGLVFRAVDSELNRTVCIKVLHPRHEFNDEARMRFERETRDVARLGSERIVSVLDVGPDSHVVDGKVDETASRFPYFVMPFLEGQSLRQALLETPRMESKRALQITRQIAEGLAYAHYRGILHRDIKPDNIWLTPSGEIKILDFGLAVSSEDSHPLTKSGTVIGTPSYMSPEQVKGHEVDHRSDLFSVGVLLAEMLTGESPFQKSNLFSTLMSVAGDPFQPETIDPDKKIPSPIMSLVESLLEKDPKQRLSSAEALVAKVNACLAELEVQAWVPALDHMDRPTRNHSRFGWIAISFLGLAMLGLAAFFAYALWKSNDFGNLVIKTSDPDVEVAVTGKKLEVYDPRTEKRFTIRLGETRLPSGAYVIDPPHRSAGIIFSSDLVVIKRGKKTIVTIAYSDPASKKDVAGDDFENDSWPIFRGNRKGTGKASTQLPKDLELLWTFKTDKDGVESTAAVVGDTVIVAGTDGKIYSIDRLTGKANWRYATGSIFMASPSVNQERIFIGDLDGTFYCLNYKGELIWKFKTDGQITSAANFYQKYVIFGSEDQKLYCVHRDTGKLKWFYETRDQILSSPTIHNNLCFIAGCDQKLHIVDVGQGESISTIDIDGPTMVTPAVTNGFVYFGTENGTTYSVELANYRKRWSVTIDEHGNSIRSSPAMTEVDGIEIMVFGTRGKEVVGVDVKNGDVLWRYKTKSDVDSSPVIVGRRVFFATNRGRLVALDATDGTFLWDSKLGGSIVASPAVAMDCLIISNDRGEVFCLGKRNSTSLGKRNSDSSEKRNSDSSEKRESESPENRENAGSDKRENVDEEVDKHQEKK